MGGQVTRTGTQNRPYDATACLMVKARLFNPDGSCFREWAFDWNDRPSVRDFAAMSDQCIREGGRTDLVSLSSMVSA